MSEKKKTGNPIYKGQSKALDEVISALEKVEKKLEALQKSEGETFKELERQGKNEKDIDCAEYVCKMLSYGYSAVEQALDDLDSLQLRDETGKVFI